MKVLNLFGKENKNKEISQNEKISNLEDKLSKTQRNLLQTELDMRTYINKLNLRIEKLEAELWRREH